ASQGKLKTCAKTIAVNGGDHGHRESVDAVDQLERLPHRLFDPWLRIEVLELADVSASNEAGLLRTHQHEALGLAARRGRLDRLADLPKLFGGTASERVHALALAVDDRPGNALEVDREAPVLQVWKRRRHDQPYSAAMCSGRSGLALTASATFGSFAAPGTLRATAAASNSSTAMTRATRSRSSARSPASSWVSTPLASASAIQSLLWKRRTSPLRMARSSFLSASSQATVLSSVYSSNPIRSLGSSVVKMSLVRRSRNSP